MTSGKNQLSKDIKIFKKIIKEIRAKNNFNDGDGSKRCLVFGDHTENSYDTLVLVKREDIDKILNKFSLFDKNFKFTADTFLSGNVHLVDVKINGNKTNVCLKETHSGQYTYYTRDTLQRFKTT